MTDQPKRYLFAVEDYHRMIEAGILSEDDRVELLNGEVVEMVALSSYHAACVARLTAFFATHLGTNCVIWAQSPILLDDHSEPEADLALLRPRLDFYADAKPTPADVLLIVEIAQATLALDRDQKMPLYAKAGVSELWIVDLDNQRVFVYRNPQPHGYRSTQTFWRGESFPLSAFPALMVSVEDILG